MCVREEGCYADSAEGEDTLGYAEAASAVLWARSGREEGALDGEPGDRKYGLQADVQSFLTIINLKIITI